MTESKDPIYFSDEQRAKYAAIRAEYAKRLDDYEKSPAGKSYRNKGRVVLASALLAPFTGGLSLIAGGIAEVVHRSNHPRPNEWD